MFVGLLLVLSGYLSLVHQIRLEKLYKLVFESQKIQYKNAGIWAFFLMGAAPIPRVLTLFFAL